VRVHDKPSADTHVVENGTDIGRPYRQAIFGVFLSTIVVRTSCVTFPKSGSSSGLLQEALLILWPTHDEAKLNLPVAHGFGGVSTSEIPVSGNAIAC
jgi:hypothetical protein